MKKTKTKDTTETLRRNIEEFARENQKLRETRDTLHRTLVELGTVEDEHLDVLAWLIDERLQLELQIQELVQTSAAGKPEIDMAENLVRSWLLNLLNKYKQPEADHATDQKN